MSGSAPLARTLKLADSPSVTLWFVGWSEMTGAERTDVAFNVTTALVAMPAALLTRSE